MSVVLFFVFFFFKQKTAYEMRISDWSSDVCSSDLRLEPAAKLIDQREGAEAEQGDVLVDASHLGYRDRAQPEDRREVDEDIERQPEHRHHGADRRSEEHTSELQSLMRISYAVFCLKKKKTNKHQKKKLHNATYQ